MAGTLTQDVRVEDEVVEDAALFGLHLSPLALNRPDHLGVWPCNEAAMRAFLTVQTQWRALAQADGSRFWVGLDYGGVEPALRLAGMCLTPDDWFGVQMIEQAARAALNER